MIYWAIEVQKELYRTTGEVKDIEILKLLIISALPVINIVTMFIYLRMDPNRVYLIAANVRAREEIKKKKKGV